MANQILFLNCCLVDGPIRAVLIQAGSVLSDGVVDMPLLMALLWQTSGRMLIEIDGEFCEKKFRNFSIFRCMEQPFASIIRVNYPNIYGLSISLLDGMFHAI
jgi:hypothetical protein